MSEWKGKGSDRRKGKGKRVRKQRKRYEMGKGASEEFERKGSEHEEGSERRDSERSSESLNKNKKWYNICTNLRDWKLVQILYHIVDRKTSCHAVTLLNADNTKKYNGN